MDHSAPHVRGRQLESVGLHTGDVATLTQLGDLG